jgi:hypothetical protein
MNIDFIAINGSDLSTIFEPLGSGVKLGYDTKFTNKGSDLNTMFAPYVTGSKADPTGYKYNQTDLSDIFMKKNNNLTPVGDFTNVRFLSSTSLSFNYVGSITGPVSVQYRSLNVQTTVTSASNTHTLSVSSPFIHGDLCTLEWTSGNNKHYGSGLYVGELSDYRHVLVSTGSEDSAINPTTYGFSSYVLRNPRPQYYSEYVGGVVIQSKRILYLTYNGINYPDGTYDWQYGRDPSASYITRLTESLPYKLTNDDNNYPQRVLFPNHRTEVTPFTYVPSSFAEEPSWQKYLYIRIYDGSVCVFSGWLYYNTNGFINGNMRPIWRMYELKSSADYYYPFV